MKISDVIRLLQENVPPQTDLFTDEISVISLTRLGSLVTAITSTSHGLTTGDNTDISGAVEENPIISLTRNGQTVTAVTTVTHDLTVPNQSQITNDNLYDFNQVLITGAAESEYNGLFLVTATPDRNTFQYVIVGTPPPDTGTPLLIQDGGYNGLVIVTVIDLTTFTYSITTTPLSPAGGVIIVRSNARISGALSLDRAIASYTPQGGVDQLWLFAVPNNSTISRDRAILSDATQEIAGGQTEYRVRQIEPFSIYLFIPATEDLTGIGLSDQAEDLKEILYHSILGTQVPSVLDSPDFSLITPVGSRFVSESQAKALYIHEYTFERVVDITFADTVGPNANKAFQSISLQFGVEGGTLVEKVIADIPLDQ